MNMKKYKIQSKDLGYYFLLIDMALIADNTEQMELEFDHDIEGNERNDEYDLNSLH